MISIYASPAGTGSGTSAADPCSLASARAAARAARGTDHVAVVLRGGTFTQNATLALTELDGGTNGFTHYWRAYRTLLGYEAPVISGARQVTGWALHDAGLGIWRAAVPVGTRSRHLVVNGQRARRARSAVGLVTSDSGATYTTSDAAFPVLSRPSDVELVFEGAPVNWASPRISIASATRVGAVTTLTTHANRVRYPNADIAWGWPAATSYLEGALEFLAAPGDFHLDGVGGWLYYVPRVGEDMATADARLAVLEQVLTTDGLANCEFQRIGFAHSTWLGPTDLGVFCEVQATMHLSPENNWDWVGTNSYGYGTAPLASVSVKGSQYVYFRRCTVQHAGGTGVTFSGGSKYCGFYRGEVYSSAACGIQVGDASHASPQLANQTSSIGIEDSTITYVGQDYAGGVGVLVLYADHVGVLHNEIAHGRYTGISFAWGWVWPGFTPYSHSIEVGWNRVHDFCATLHDGGGIYSPGPCGEAPNRSTVHDNYLYAIGSTDLDRPLYADTGCTATWTRNVIARAGAQPYWLLTNNPGASVAASSNYATQGMTFLETIGSHAIEAAIPLVGADPAGWPGDAASIVAGAGVRADDATAPVVTDFVLPDTPHAGRAFQIEVVATDAVGVTDYGLTVDGGAETWQASGIFDLLLARGDHTLTARARDEANNISDPWSEVLTVVEGQDLVYVAHVGGQNARFMLGRTWLKLRE